MIDPYEELDRIRFKKSQAEDEFRNAKKAVEEFELKFRQALTVGNNTPCRVAILPNGKAIVHVWVENSSNPNQLHIVKPESYTEDAKLIVCS